MVNICTDKIEQQLLKDGFNMIAGVDEVGRGALAGPVLAAAVILDLNNIPKGLNDSKRLSQKQREKLAIEIKQSALAISIAEVSAEEIDKINIHQASLKAMIKAVTSLKLSPNYLLIDGFALSNLKIKQQAIIKGDSLSVSIAAASIAAKVTRDKLMYDYALHWPNYGFEKHVGYATRLHLDSLRKYGPCDIHRRSFQGVEILDLQPTLPLILD
jgi:ribonuclease HII